MASDEKFMREAIRVAKKGVGKTRPNPAVGCVIVKGGRIIGRGWHRRAGSAHAEIEALLSLKNPSTARGATAYVTLEPCCTHGKTPPCTDALVAAGVSRVVIGAIDPNPKHRGRGMKLLRRERIRTKCGVLAAECAALNAEFNHTMRTGLPWVIAKCGMSLDGRITRPPGEGQWITSPSARRDAMKLRAAVDAVMVGAGTVRADDPALTLRGVKGRQPLRVIWAPRRPPPKGAQLMRAKAGTGVAVLPQKNLRAALLALAKRGVQRVLLEGGGYTMGRAFEAGLVQEVVFFVAPMLAGGGVPAVGGKGAAADSRSRKLNRVRASAIGRCLRLSGRLAE